MNLSRIVLALFPKTGLTVSPFISVNGDQEAILGDLGMAPTTRWPQMPPGKEYPQSPMAKVCRAKYNWVAQTDGGRFTRAWAMQGGPLAQQV